MSKNEKTKILIAGGVGTIIGGIFVAVTTNAIPTMMEAISATMMGKMMKGFVETQNR